MNNLTDAISEFLVAQEADGSSAATLRWYRSLLHKFEQFAGGDCSLDAVTTAIIRAYMIQVRRTYTDDTAHGHLRSQHKFWRWCASEYGIANPMRNIRYPPPPRQTVPKAATNSDIARLFQAIDTSEAIGLRNRAIVAFLVDTGARAAGVCSLTMDALDVQARHAFAREYLRSGGDLATLSRLLGHQDVSTTVAHYTVYTLDELAVQHEQHSLLRLVLDSTDPGG